MTNVAVLYFSFHSLPSLDILKAVIVGTYIPVQMQFYMYGQ